MVLEDETPEETKAREVAYYAKQEEVRRPRPTIRLVLAAHRPSCTRRW